MKLLQPSSQSLFQVLIRRQLTAALTYVIVLILAGGIVMQHKIKYAGIAHVLLVNDQTGRDPADAGLDMPVIVTSTTVLQEVQRKLGLTGSVAQLRKSIAARVSPRSSIMAIVGQDTNPQRALDLPNAVADSFVEQYSKLSNARYDQVTGRLRSELVAKRRAVLRIERRLELASAGATYVGSQASLDASAAHLADLREARGSAYDQLVTDRSTLSLGRGEESELSGVVRHEILMNNALFRQSEIEVGRDVAGYTTTRAGVRVSYPGIAGFQNKIDNEAVALRKLRSAALRSPDAYSPSEAGQRLATDKAVAAMTGDEAKISDLDGQIKSAKAALSSAPSSGESIGALRAERDAAETQFGALALRVTNAEANSAESSSLGQVVVVDRAVTAETTLLGRPQLIGLAAIAAALMAVLAAYAAEIFIPRLIEDSDIERVYGHPALATLHLTQKA